MAKVEDLIGLALLAGFAFLSLGVYAQASDCVTCHNETASSGNAVIDVPAMNLSSNASHRNLTEGIINTSTISDEIDKACWACHWNGTDPNTTHPNKTTYTPWLCYDCHANTTGGINTTASKGNYSAPATYSHIPANAMASYTAPTNINTSAQCVECHNNSIGANIDTGGPPENNTINSTVSHYGTNLSLVKNTGANCTYCHVQPNATVRALWGTNVSLSSWPASNTSFRGLIRHETNVSYCDNCHGNLSSSITLHSNQLKKDISVHYAFDWEGDDADEYPPWDLVPGSGRDNRYESCYACHRDGMAFGASSNYKICEDCHLPNGSGPFNYSDRFPSGFGTEDFVLRSDLQPWSTVNREALGIPIIYSHVPYNSIQNSTTDIDVKRNLSGETGETGMSTQSSCFSWNTSNQNGTCHGVGYSARLQATPPADLNEGKEYFMHYGDKQYGSGPRTYYFNETYMNTYIQDYAPNTTDCLWCHNQSNASVRRYWGNAFQVNATNMFGAQNNSDCYSCHTLNNTPPQNFHADGFTFGGGPDCVLCHDIGLTSAADVDVSKMNASASPQPIHRRLNNLTSTPGFQDTNFTGNNDSKRCWACHSNGSRPFNMGLNYLTPWLCYDCHTNTTGGINTTSLRGNYSAPAVFSHIPANAMDNYSTSYQTNITTTVQCWICHNNSVASTNDTEPGPQLGHTAKSNVSHYGITTFLVNNSAGNCTYCHRQANATIRGMWGTNAPLRYWPNSTTSIRGFIRHKTNVSFCVNCHGNLSSSISLHSNQVKKDISVHYAFDWEGDDADEYPPWDLVPGSGRDNRYESCYACHRDGMAFGASSNYKICEDCHLPNGSGPFNYSDRFPSGFGTEDFVLRSDLSGWNISDREALGIPVIYSHVPYNEIWNISDVKVKRNLSGLTGETGMSTASSCFSWNPSNQNGTCHGVGYSARLQATPPADLNEGKEYFMHYGDKQYGSGPRTYYFNETYMNTYIQDYAPNTTDCLWCHNQTNASVRRYWGNPIQVKLNTTGGYDPNAMYGAQSNSDCYTCHVDSRQQPKNFHVEEINPGTDCALCHFNYSRMLSYNASEKWINETMFNASVHGNRSVIFCTNCHTMTEGHPPPESRWHWCEDCHVVMPTYVNGTPRKGVQQRHNMTFKPQYTYVNVGGTMTSVINVTDCTACHDTTMYNQARSIFNKTSGKNCRYCHSFSDLNPDSPY